jgi:hypothetical protein
VRGSKIPLDPGSTIRFFLWWTEQPSERTDIDLSAILFNPNWGHLDYISYSNLRGEGFEGYHSGDITSAPEGAAEFIDLDLESVVKFGARYAVMNVYAFTDTPFHALPECFVGWMMRQHPNSGEIFDARTVQNKIDLVGDTRVMLPVVIDLVDRVVMWADLTLQRSPRVAANVEGHLSQMALLGKSVEALIKPSLHDLFSLHAEARGATVVTERSDADLVFSVEEGVTPFDLATIVGEYL